MVVITENKNIWTKACMTVTLSTTTHTHTHTHFKEQLTDVYYTI